MIAQFFHNTASIKIFYRRKSMWLLLTIFLVAFICLIFPNAVYTSQSDDSLSQDKPDKGMSPMDFLLREAESIPVQPDEFSLEKLKDVTLPSYLLAEDFPLDKIEIFHNLISFSALTDKYGVLSLVQARLDSSNPVRYEDLLAAVTLICYFAYTPMIDESPNAVSFFMQNILTPLSNDLKTTDYAGYRFDVDDYIDFYVHSGDILAKLHRVPPKLGELRFLPFPKSWDLLRKCVDTFWDIHEGNLFKAYNQLTVLLLRRYYYERLNFEMSRPYYYYKDEDRYRWFMFLFKELRRVGYTDFANEVFSTEVDHYRELVNWQLQTRVYLTKRLFKENARDDFKAFKKLLEYEYSQIMKDGITRESFVKAVNALRDIDEEASVLHPTEETVGAITLPWIDREEINIRMGFQLFHERGERVKVMTWTWEEYLKRREYERKSMEDAGVDNTEIMNLQEEYEWSTIYLRALVLMNASLHSESKLEALTCLHEKLVNNKGISYTEEDYFFSENRSVFVNGKTDALLKELGYDREDKMTGEGGVLPWIKVRDDWFDR